MGYQLVPSILSADFAFLSREMKTLEKLSIRFLHIDVMDGHFVPNITIGPCVIQKMRRKTKMFFDVHLMLQRPQDFIQSFCMAGADSITVHFESDHDILETIRLIRLYRKKVGIALNQDTPLRAIKDILEHVDLVLVMSVYPGFGGQNFLKSVLPKIRKIRNIIDEKNFNIDLQVDGGLNDQTVVAVKKAGANRFVMGHYLFHKRQIVKTVKKLQRMIDSEKKEFVL